MHIRSRQLPVLLALLLCSCSSAQSSPPVTTPTFADPGLLVPRTTAPIGQQILPQLVQRDQLFAEVAKQPIPILTLRDGLDDKQRRAQDLAMQNADFGAGTRDDQTGQPLRAEIFGVYPARASDATGPAIFCQNSTCYRVELYNYARNLTTVAIVDIDKKQVVAVNRLEGTQPDIPLALEQIGLAIAAQAPEVQQALGVAPKTSDAVMANTKTALNKTRCERSHHLCVAPTFVQGSRALWAIVDLTDGVLVGTRWTEVGTVAGPALTEKGLQNDVLIRQFCEKTTPLSRDGWELDYILTSSDGLRISNVRYKGKSVLDSAKLVDWHVSYSRTDGFGYSDAVGCPVFSQAAVVAINGPKIEAIREGDAVVGFQVEQEFWSELWPMPCNYYYEQTYQFYLDGRFRPVVKSLGRGCGNDGTYRPVTRIAFAGTNTFAEWTGSDWKKWDAEGWRQQNDLPATSEHYQFRILNGSGEGYAIAPGSGQFNDGGRGDNAYVYVTKRHQDRDEGDADLVTIGPCCNIDFHQGPEKFIDATPEPITSSELVVWYVAQLKNDDTPTSPYCWADTIVQNGIFVPREWPCTSGPMFVPVHP